MGNRADFKTFVENYFALLSRHAAKEQEIPVSYFQYMKHLDLLNTPNTKLAVKREI